MSEFHVVTADNIEDVRENMGGALDQRDELEVGCETWRIVNDHGVGGHITVWPHHGRAAICWNGDSEWGDWNEKDRTLTLEDGQVIDEFGGEVTDDEEPEE